MRFFRKDNPPAGPHASPRTDNLSTQQIVASILPMFKRTNEDEIKLAVDLIDRGIELAIQGNIRESESCFYRLIKIHPELVTAWTDCALKMNPDGFDREFLQATISRHPIDYDIVLSAYPNSSRTLIWKGWSLDKLGNSQQALECYKKAIGINPDSILILWTKLRVDLEINRNYKEAMDVLRAILAIEPSSVVALTLMGGVLGQTGRAEEGLSYFDQALSLDPTSADALCDKGATLEKLARFDEALDCLEKAVTLQPNHYPALTNRGVILQTLGRKQEAMDSYDRALKIAPMYPNALYNKARLTASLGQYEEAIDLLKRAIQADPACRERASRAHEFQTLKDQENFRQLLKK